MQLPIQVEVNVQNLCELESISGEPTIETCMWQGWLEIWLEKLATYLPEADAYELSLRLTNDVEIQTLNAQYRHLDRPTDVLAFAILEGEFSQTANLVFLREPLSLGDIVISVETAWKQAQQQGHSLTKELAWLAAHGLLHLLGWDHPDETSLIKMLEEQENLLGYIGFA
jgi:probable rRNA maturation factor